MLIHQAKLTSDECDIGAEETLTELIDNNRKILETKISTETIGVFLEMLLTEKDGKYAKLVQALCICDGQPMVFNQAEVSQRLLFDEKFFDGLVAPLKKLETNDFVLEMLSLLSSLCMGRNYIAIEKLKDLFT